MKKDDVAYIDFSYNSFGHYVGMNVTYQNIFEQVDQLKKMYVMDSNDKVLSTTDCRQNLSFIMLLTCLYSGSSILTLDDDAQKNPIRWLNYCRNNSVSIILINQNHLLTISKPLLLKNITERSNYLRSVRIIFLDSSGQYKKIKSRLILDCLSIFQNQGLDHKSELFVLGSMSQGGFVFASHLWNKRYIERHIDIAYLKHNKIKFIGPEKPSALSLMDSGASFVDTRIVVIDPATGNIVGPNETGELWVHGPHFPNSFVGPNNQTKTIESLKFLKTGLHGFINEDRVFILGVESERIRQLSERGKPVVCYTTDVLSKIRFEFPFIKRYNLN